MEEQVLIKRLISTYSWRFVVSPKRAGAACVTKLAALRNGRIWVVGMRHLATGGRVLADRKTTLILDPPNLPRNERNSFREVSKFTACIGDMQCMTYQIVYAIPFR
jgi:hypothetical protein